MIYLSPSKMKELHLQKGSPVTLSCPNGELLFRCWPGAPKVLEAALPAFTLLKHYTGFQHSMTSFKSCVFEADCIVLSPCKFRKFMNDEDFLSFLKRKLDSVYIKEGMILQLNYLGCSLSLTVQTVVSSFVKNTDKNILNSSFSSLEGSLIEKCNKGTFELQSSTPVSSPRLQFHNKSNRSKQFYFIGVKTRCIIDNLVSKRQNGCKIKDIAGLDEEINVIKSSITPLLDPDFAFGIQKILVVGPQGSGKSFLIDAIQNDYKHLLPLHDIKNVVYSKGIGFLKKLLIKIESKSPCIVLIDDIDKLFENKDLHSDLSSIIYKMLSSSCLLMIATCQSTDSIPGDLLKEGLIDKKTIPSASNRVQIAEKVLQIYENDLTKGQICELSDMAHGFTGGDLKRLCQEAYLKAIEEDSPEGLITLNHLQKSFINIKPSSIEQLILEVPDVKWGDIGGMNEVKEAVKEMVDWPLKHPEKLKKFKLVPPRGILMYGPPGCSKTLIAKALASESQLNFLSVKSSQIFNMYVGESEKSVTELFKKARAAAPCILFLDEVDSIIPKRGSSANGSSNVTDRVVTQFLVEIDGIDVLEEGVSVIAATNRPERVDASLLRPGRLDRLIYVHLPDEKTRTEIFQVLLKKKLISDDIDLQYLVHKTANYTGAEISAVCLEASKNALKEGKFLSRPPVSMKHFLSALKNVHPRTTKEMLDSFENYHQKFQFKT